MILDAIYNYILFDFGPVALKSVLFLFVAAIGIRTASSIVRRLVSRKFSEKVVIDLITDISRLFMWFWAVLITLSILGFSGIATSLGTASGFVALGIAFALKNVLSDTVAGIYLAKDQDFNSGDEVEVDGVKGKIRSVGLRKTRIELEEDELRVINNTDVEKKWTKLN